LAAADGKLNSFGTGAAEVVEVVEEEEEEGEMGRGMEPLLTKSLLLTVLALLLPWEGLSSVGTTAGEEDDDDGDELEVTGEDTDVTSSSVPRGVDCLDRALARFRGVVDFLVGVLLVLLLLLLLVGVVGLGTEVDGEVEGLMALLVSFSVWAQAEMRALRTMFFRTLSLAVSFCGASRSILMGWAFSMIGVGGGVSVTSGKGGTKIPSVSRSEETEGEREGERGSCSVAREGLGSSFLTGRSIIEMDRPLLLSVFLTGKVVGSKESGEAAEAETTNSGSPRNSSD
jgi:hypothetical protein